MNIEELFKSQEWQDLIKGLQVAYEKEGYRIGAKQWQEFYNTAFKAGQDAELLRERENFDNIITQMKNETREAVINHVEDNIGRLRQWLNEDRITEPKKMVTNEQIATWILTSIP